MPAPTRRRILIEKVCLVVGLVFGGYELLDCPLLIDRLGLETRDVAHIPRGWLRWRS